MADIQVDPSQVQAISVDPSEVQPMPVPKGAFVGPRAPAGIPQPDNAQLPQAAGAIPQPLSTAPGGQIPHPDLSPVDSAGNPVAAPQFHYTGHERGFTPPQGLTATSPADRAVLHQSLTSPGSMSPLQSEPDDSALTSTAKAVVSTALNLTSAKSLAMMLGAQGLTAALGIAVNGPVLKNALSNAPSVARALEIAAHAAVPATFGTLGLIGSGQEALEATKPDNTPAQTIQHSVGALTNLILAGLGTYGAIEAGKGIASIHPREATPEAQAAAAEVGGIARPSLPDARGNPQPITPAQATATAQAMEAQGHHLAGGAWQALNSKAPTPIIVDGKPLFLHPPETVRAPPETQTIQNPDEPWNPPTQVETGPGKLYPAVRVTDADGNTVMGLSPESMVAWLRKKGVIGTAKTVPWGVSRFGGTQGLSPEATAGANKLINTFGEDVPFIRTAHGTRQIPDWMQGKVEPTPPPIAATATPGETPAPSAAPEPSTSGTPTGEQGGTEAQSQPAATTPEAPKSIPGIVPGSVFDFGQRGKYSVTAVTPDSVTVNIKGSQDGKDNNLKGVPMPLGAFHQLIAENYPPQQESAQPSGTKPAVSPPTPPLPSEAPAASNDTGTLAEPHDLASTQVNLPAPLAGAIAQHAAGIPDDQLAPKGREDQPHITVKYGLHDDDPSAVQELLKNQPPITATLGKTSLFHTDDADVLKVDVDSPDLHALNSKIAEARPHTETHPVYQPHVTIAYLKKGEGEQYAGKDIPGVTGQQVTLNSLTFSGKDDKQTEIPLYGKTGEEPHAQPDAESAPLATKGPGRGGESGRTGGPGNPQPHPGTPGEGGQGSGQAPEVTPAPTPEASTPKTSDEALRDFAVGDRISTPAIGGGTLIGTVEKIGEGGKQIVPGVFSKPTLSVRIEKHEGLPPGKQSMVTIGGLGGVDPLEATKLPAETGTKYVLPSFVTAPHVKAATKPAPPGPIPSTSWMNRMDIDEAVDRYKNHPVLSRATKFLSDLRDEVDDHSDGWPYWKLPIHAAAQLMGMIQHPEYATEENFKKALSPIRAFYTRAGNKAGMRFPDVKAAEPAAKPEVKVEAPVKESTPVNKPAPESAPDKAAEWRSAFDEYRAAGATEKEARQLTERKLGAEPVAAKVQSQEVSAKGGSGEQVPLSKQPQKPEGGTTLYRSNANSPMPTSGGFWATPSHEFAQAVGDAPGNIASVALPKSANILDLAKPAGYTPDEAMAALKKAFPKASSEELNALVDRSLWTEDDREHYDIPDLIHATEEQPGDLLTKLAKDHGYDAIKFQEGFPGSDMAHEGRVQKGRVPSYFLRIPSEPPAQQSPAASPLSTSETPTASQPEHSQTEPQESVSAPKPQKAQTALSPRAQKIADNEKKQAEIEAKIKKAELEKKAAHEKALESVKRIREADAKLQAADAAREYKPGQRVTYRGTDGLERGGTFDNPAVEGSLTRVLNHDGKIELVPLDHIVRVEPLAEFENHPAAEKKADEEAAKNKPATSGMDNHTRKQVYETVIDNLRNDVKRLRGLMQNQGQAWVIDETDRSVKNLRASVAAGEEIVEKIPPPDQSNSLNALKAAIVDGRVLLTQAEQKPAIPAELDLDALNGGGAAQEALDKALDDALNASLGITPAAPEPEPTRPSKLPPKIRKALSAVSPAPPVAPSPAPTPPIATPFDEAAAKARKELEAMFSGEQLNAGIDPKALLNLGLIGAQTMMRGAIQFKDWSARMIEDLGGFVRTTAAKAKTTVEKVLRQVHEFSARAVRKHGIAVEAAPPETAEKPTIESHGTDAGADGETGSAGVGLRPEGAGPLAGVSSEDVPGAPKPGETLPGSVGGHDQDTGSDAGTHTQDELGPGGGDRVPGVVPPAVRGGPTQPDLQSVPAPAGLRGDYRLTPDEAARIESGGPKIKARANLEAIRTIKQIIAEGNRPATLEEQQKIARYVGWGMSELAQGMFKDNKTEYAGLREELRGLLTPEELETARDSTINAHYTRRDVAAAMWDAIRSMGFRAGGSVIEPGMGIGNFFMTMPEDLQPDTSRTGVEMDLITGAMAKALFPGSNVLIKPFQQSNLPDGYFDVAIGNVPFANHEVTDPAFKRKPYLTANVHNYFFAKSMEKLRPGGVMLAITSRYTMDSQDKAFRNWMNEQAELLGAIRLPNDTFKANAGTSVTVDIIALRKRLPDGLSVAQSEGRKENAWQESPVLETKDGFKVNVNEYYHAHPEMMMGEMGAGTQYHKGYPELQGEFSLEKLKDMLGKLPQDVVASWSKPAAAQGDLAEEYPEASHIKDHQYGIVKGAVVQRDGAYLKPVTLKGTKLDRMKGLIELRGAAREAIRSQRLDLTEPEILAARKKLNEVYDGFVKKFGPVNVLGNSSVFSDDPDWPVLAGLLEDYDKQGMKEARKALGGKQGEYVISPKGSVMLAVPGNKTPFVVATKRPIFRERTIQKPQRIEHVDTGAEALAVSLNDHNRIDWDRMQELTGREPSELQRELGGQIFRDPISKQWETADEYLSGNVRQKLRDAEFAAKERPEFAGNVEALKAVQPTWKTAGKIKAPLGATWVPDTDYSQFAEEILKVERDPADRLVRLVPLTGGFAVRPSFTFTDNGIADKTDFGTPYFSGMKLFEMALNGNAPVARDYYEDMDGNEKSVKNADATIAANEKQQRLHDKFATWLWADPDRANRLAEKFNWERNNLRLREYDGSHMKLPGLNKTWLRSGEPEPHQKNAVWRTLQSGNTLYAHAVGAGKTLEGVMAAMELRRLGLAKKPAMVVPNHLVGQWRDDWMRAYPGAQILVPTKKDFDKQNRQKLMARIAGGNYDGVIMGHQSFGKIPVKDETFNAFVDKQLKEIVDAIGAASEGKDKKDIFKDPTVKQLVRRRKQLEAKLEKRAKRADKDTGLSFEELGIDHIFVDEADLFKNLGYTTMMDRIAGLPNTDSDRATDMLLKSQYVMGLHGGDRGVVFMTGTPVSNSIAEIWTMMRYLMPQYLEREGMDQFDAWAKTFGQTRTQMEVAPEGGRFIQRTRFAKFQNAGQMMNMFRLVADIRTASQLNLPVPAIWKGGAVDVVAPSTPELKAFVQNIGVRADAVRAGEVEPDEDNMLKISSDGRKASLDMRLIDSRYPEAPKSKANLAVANVLEVYREYAEHKATQLIFLDLSTPKSEKVSKKKASGEVANSDVANVDAAPADEDTQAENVYGEKEEPEEEEVETKDEARERFTVYQDIKKKLIAGGIPAEEIAFIQDAKTDAQKTDLFDKMNRGQVRVLLGSTEKMGAGMNVQQRLVALHHLDAPWRPRDMAQREGRIIRQGNKLWDDHKIPARIYRYLTEGSFDAFMWETLAAKAAPIQQLMEGDPSMDDVDELSPLVLSYDQAKALSSGNPMIRDKILTDQEVHKLDVMRGSWLTEQASIGQQLAQLPGQLTRYKEGIAQFQQDIATRDANPALVVGGQSFAGKDIRTAGAAALTELLKGMGTTVENDTPIDAAYRGFPLVARSQTQSIDVAGPKKAMRYEVARVPQPDGKFMYYGLPQTGPKGYYQPGELTPLDQKSAEKAHAKWDSKEWERYWEHVYAAPALNLKAASGTYQISTNYTYPAGIIQSLEHQVDFEPSLKSATDQLRRLDKSKVELESKQGEPFQYEAKLQELQRKQAELAQKLGENENDRQALGAAEEGDARNPLTALIKDPSVSLHAKWFPGKKYFMQGAGGYKNTVKGYAISKYLAVEERAPARKGATPEWQVDHVPTGMAVRRFPTDYEAVAYALQASKAFNWDFSEAPKDLGQELNTWANTKFIPPTETPEASMARLDAAKNAGKPLPGAQGDEALELRHQEIEQGHDVERIDNALQVLKDGSDNDWEINDALRELGIDPDSDESGTPEEQLAKGEKKFDAAVKARQATRRKLGGLFVEQPERKGVREHGGVPARILTAPLTAAERFVTHDVIPTAMAAAQGIRAAKADIQSLLAPASVEGAQTGALIIRQRAAELAQGSDRAEKALATLHKYLDSRTPQQNYDLMDRIESGNPLGSNAAETAFADIARWMLDGRRDAIQALGTGKLETYYENYFPHIWADPAKAQATIRGIFAKRPLEGKKSFLKKRTILTIKDGLAAGLELASTNPVDLVLAKVREMDKYLMAHHVMDDLKGEGLLQYVRSGEHAPPDLEQINDPVATVYGPHQGAVGLPTGANIEPEDVTVYGQRIMGKYYAPAPVARLVNNFLSPGLRDKSGLFRAYLGLGNVMNQFQLGYSAFHLTFTTVDAMTSKLALALYQAGHGDIRKALVSAAQTPFAPFLNLVRGNKILREWYAPGTQGAQIAQLVDAMLQAGGRARMDSFYRTNMTKKMLEAFRKGNVMGALLRAPMAVTEQMAKPIMEWIVPRLKMGVFADMARYELERLGHSDAPGTITLNPASAREVQAALARAWDSVDNRMGQLVYDNLFWSKTLKDLAMASIRSVGWNLGTERELGGGLLDYGRQAARVAGAGGGKVRQLAGGKGYSGPAPELTPRMAYVAALPMLVGLIGAIMTYLMTGHGPKELKDYFAPKDSRGKRWMIASYMKDVYGYAKHPLDTVEGKIHPLAQLIWQMLQNKDFFGHEIRNADDPIVKQLLEELKHVGNAFEPMGMRMMGQGGKRRPLVGNEKILPFIGVTPAPKSIDSPAKAHHRMYHPQ